MTTEILIFGFLFGAILQYAKLNKYNVISGLATLEDFTVPKALFLAIGLGALLLNITIVSGFAEYHVKPFILGGLLIGGIIFGSGMAILGYCPGTMAISAGEGSLDAVVGIIGGLFGGWLYTVLSPSLKGILGADLGKISLSTIIDSKILFFVAVLAFSALFIGISFFLDKKKKSDGKKWIYSGVSLAVLNVIVFLKATTNRPIGASTTFPYLADVITKTVNNDYFEKIKTPGHWELIFLAGAFLAGLIISLTKKDFKFKLIYSRWEKYKGKSKTKRILWAFTGGFLVIFGARMAGGCTSGHILSGGMQIAFSSLFFAVFVFVGLLITGKLFYKRAV